MHILKCACCIYLRWDEMIWYDMIWYDNDMIWYDMIGYDTIFLVIPCFFMQYEKILMVWVRITLGFQPRVIRTQTINIVRIAWEQTGGNKFITQ